MFFPLKTKQPTESSLPQAVRRASCPRCRSEVAESAKACGTCGFSLSLCDAIFPFEPPPLSLVVDPSRVVPPGIEKHLARPYKALRKRIPQVDICFCFVQLQHGYSVEEFAFWLFNTAPGADQSRAWNLLVTVDLLSGQLSLTSGYALEPFLVPESWGASLQELAACLGDGQWNEGLAGFLRDSRDLLSSACYVARRHAQAHQYAQSEAPRTSEDSQEVISPVRPSRIPPEQKEHHQPAKEPITTGP